MELWGCCSRNYVILLTVMIMLMYLSFLIFDRVKLDMMVD